MWRLHPAGHTAWTAQQASFQGYNVGSGQKHAAEFDRDGVSEMGFVAACPFAFGVESHADRAATTVVNHAAMIHQYVGKH